MKKKFYIFVAIFLVFYVIFSLNFILNPQKGFSYKILTKILPKNIKNKFRDIYYGSFNSQISNLESRLKSAEDIIKNQKNLSLDLEVGDRSKDTFIIDSLINLQIPLLFKKTKTKQKINNTDYLLSKFSNNILDNGVGAYAKASAYLDIYNNHIQFFFYHQNIFPKYKNLSYF